MILTCPACATRYQSDASSFLPDGRKVRCAKCGEVWFQPPPPPEPQDEAPPEPAPVAPAPAVQPAPTTAAFSAVPASRVIPVAPPAPPRRWLEPLGIAVGWAALALIVFLIAWSVIRYRETVATLWPQSASLYSALGMKVNTLGLEFQNRTAHYEKEDGQDVLVITGNVVNLTARELAVPSIRASLSGDDRHELYHWIFEPGTDHLGPHEAAPFHTRLLGAPADARHIELRFVPKTD
jgi:predicted Zn finger-like uncharacterized protein